MILFSSSFDLGFITEVCADVDRMLTEQTRPATRPEGSAPPSSQLGFDAHALYETKPYCSSIELI